MTDDEKKKLAWTWFCAGWDQTGEGHNAEWSRIGEPGHDTLEGIFEALWQKRDK